MTAPRCLDVTAAAVYLSITEAAFRRRVASGGLSAPSSAIEERTPRWECRVNHGLARSQPPPTEPARSRSKRRTRPTTHRQDWTYPPMALRYRKPLPPTNPNLFRSSRNTAQTRGRAIQPRCGSVGQGWSWRITPKASRFMFFRHVTVPTAFRA